MNWGRSGGGSKLRRSPAVTGTTTNTYVAAVSRDIGTAVHYVAVIENTGNYTMNVDVDVEHADPAAAQDNQYQNFPKTIAPGNYGVVRASLGYALFEIKVQSNVAGNHTTYSITQQLLRT